LSVRLLRLFACRGDASMDNICSGYQTNAPAETLYDGAQYLALVLLLLLFRGVICRHAVHGVHRPSKNDGH